ncbi:hypothetical protein HNQ56_000733 [Anaerotaenia torta]
MNKCVLYYKRAWRLMDFPCTPEGRYRLPGFFVV